MTCADRRGIDISVSKQVLRDYWLVGGRSLQNIESSPVFMHAQRLFCQPASCALCLCLLRQLTKASVGRGTRSLAAAKSREGQDVLCRSLLVPAVQGAGWAWHGSLRAGNSRPEKEGDSQGTMCPGRACRCGQDTALGSPQRRSSARSPTCTGARPGRGASLGPRSSDDGGHPSD